MTCVHLHPHDCQPSDDATPETLRRLSLVLGMIVVSLGLYYLGGGVSGSLTLIAKANHMLSDVGMFALALLATWSTQAPALRKFLGPVNIELLAALLNGMVLLLVVWVNGVEAVERLSSPPEIQGGMMLAVSLLGLAVNGLILSALHEPQQNNLNVKGVYLHSLLDMLASVGALVAAVLISVFHWSVVDPIFSLVIGAGIALYTGKFLVEVLQALARHGENAKTEIQPSV